MNRPKSARSHARPGPPPPPPPTAAKGQGHSSPRSNEGHESPLPPPPLATSTVDGLDSSLPLPPPPLCALSKSQDNVSNDPANAVVSNTNNFNKDQKKAGHLVTDSTTTNLSNPSLNKLKISEPIKSQAAGSGSSTSSLNSNDSSGGGGKSPRPNYRKSRPAPPPPKPPDSKLLASPKLRKAPSPPKSTNSVHSGTAIGSPQLLSSASKDSITKVPTPSSSGNSKPASASPKVSSKSPVVNSKAVGEISRPDITDVKVTSAIDGSSHVVSGLSAVASKETVNNTAGCKEDAKSSSTADVSINTADTKVLSDSNNKGAVLLDKSATATGNVGQLQHRNKSIAKPSVPPPQPPPVTATQTPPPPQVLDTAASAPQSRTQASNKIEKQSNKMAQSHIPAQPCNDNMDKNTRQVGAVSSNHSKPSITSPKPKLKPSIAPPPPPPHTSNTVSNAMRDSRAGKHNESGEQPCINKLQSSAHNATGAPIVQQSHNGNTNTSTTEPSLLTPQQNGTINSSTVSDNGNHCGNLLAQSNGESSSMSDLMRDVLGVIDKQKTTPEKTTREKNDQQNSSPNSSSTNLAVAVKQDVGDKSAVIINAHCKVVGNGNQGNDLTLEAGSEPTQATNPDQTQANNSASNISNICGVNAQSRETDAEIKNTAHKTSDNEGNLQQLTIQIDNKFTDKVPAAGVVENSAASPTNRYSQLSTSSSTGQYSPTHKPCTVHSRGQNSPKRPVKRKKSALGMLLCCGLRGSLLRDKHIPPFELPMRTEGTLPRGNNVVVKSTSLPSGIVPVTSQSSPKRLEQSDMVVKNSQFKFEKPEITGSVPNIASQRETSPSDINVNDDVDGHSHSGREFNATADTAMKDKGNLAQPKAASDKSLHLSDKSRANRDMIDVLCASEAQIAINTLQGDNKDLVVSKVDKDVTDKNAQKLTPNNTFVDVNNRPVVQCVKLVKLERSSTFSTNQNHSRASTPGLSTTHPNNATDRLSASHMGGHMGGHMTAQLANRSHYSSFTSNYSAQSQPNPDVVKMRRDSDKSNRDPSKVRSQSLENLTNIGIELDFDLAGRFERQEGYRSSFVGGDDLNSSKPALTRAPGEVQTLLKHSSQGADKVYALPQPACYGDNTLKAVKMITDKYDTLERWKICATSFRGDGTTRKSSGGGGAVTSLGMTSPSMTSPPMTSPHMTSPSMTSPSRQISSESKRSAGDIINETMENDVFIEDSIQQQQQNPQPQSVPNSSQSKKPALVTPPQNHCPELLLPQESARVQLFYSSQETVVTPANCVAGFQLSVKEVEKASDVREWTEPPQAGVPAFVLNTGAGRHRRELHIVIADRDTSFPIWTDKINHLSQFGPLNDTLYAMHLSASLLKVAAFQFPNKECAVDFWDKFKEITKDPNDDLWKVSLDPKAKPNNKKRNKNTSKVTLKGEISQPIQFDHVTNVSARDASLADFVSNEGGVGEEEESMRHRTYSS